MNTKFKSIVDEIADYVPLKDKDLFLESRARQLIASANHVLNLIRECYDEDVADDLTKRLLLAIKNDDQARFTKKVRKLREGKIGKKPL